MFTENNLVTCNLFITIKTIYFCGPPHVWGPTLATDSHYTRY